MVHTLVSGQKWKDLPDGCGGKGGTEFTIGTCGPFGTCGGCGEGCGTNKDYCACMCACASESHACASDTHIPRWVALTTRCMLLQLCALDLPLRYRRAVLR